MRITVSGKQLELSDALRTRVENGLDTVTGKYFDHALEAHDLAHRERPQAARQYVLRQEEDTPANGDVKAATYATVIAETPTEIAVLTVSDAVMRMDLADQQVMMFRNSATGVLNVVYRRSDGHIGWIDPNGAS
jgi:hypothetical protein